MNRIAGVLNFDGVPVNSVEIRGMLDAMRFDFLDEQISWINGEIGIGCVQIDGNKGNQQTHPLIHTSPEQGVIALDGRIDNRRELIATLGLQQGTETPYLTNENLVLSAYKKWDLGCAQHLIGDFAFAIWDSKKHQLICVRDHFGVKPLYYFISKAFIAFASSPHVLYAHPRAQVAINHERIADFLVEYAGGGLEGINKSCTFYENVFRLPPAHLLVLRPGKVSLRCYWELQPVANPGLITGSSYIDAFTAVFNEAVRCRVESTSAPVSMLSGGLDSSSVVAAARRIRSEENKNELDIIAVVSNSPELNRETSYVGSVLSQGFIHAHLLSETQLIHCVDELVKAIENEQEPFDCLMNLNRLVFLEAHYRNFSAVLDGIDGDMLLTDSGHLIQLWRNLDLRAVLDETFCADGLTAEYKMGRNKFYMSLLQLVLLSQPDWVRNTRRRFINRRAAQKIVSRSIINHDFASESLLEKHLAELDTHTPRPPSLSQVEFHKIVLNHTYLTAGLERYERVASAFGIEACHPFADVRLAEFCLGLPWQWKTRHGWTKYILRRAMEPLLPADVIWRSDKDSLMWEMNRLILKQRAEYFHQATLDEKEILKPYVDTQKLERIWQEYLTQGNEKHAMLIWSGIALAFWLRRHRNMVRDFKL